MSISLDDIWDDEIAPTTTKPPSPPPIHIDDDDNAFEELAPSLDLAALRKEADARAARAPQPKAKEIVTSTAPVTEQPTTTTGKKKGKSGPRQPRKPIARLNETALLDVDAGFPALVKQAKNFIPKGKGHEASDLNRLLQVYNFWSHKLYPKGQFKDNVQRIEKLCHSKRMHVALSVWNDEAKGLVNGRKIDDPIDLTSSGSEDDGENEEDGKEKHKANTSETAPSSPPAVPPSSASEYTSMAEDDDVDMDALIREDEERLAPSNSARNVGRATTQRVDAIRGVPDVTDEDEAMWAQLGADLDELANPSTSSISKPSIPRAPVDEDEDMWDVVREMEMEDATKGTNTSTSGPHSAAGAPHPHAAVTVAEDTRPTNDEGWDEMYAELDP